MILFFIFFFFHPLDSAVAFPPAPLILPYNMKDFPLIIYVTVILLSLLLLLLLLFLTAGAYVLFISNKDRSV